MFVYILIVYMMLCLHSWSNISWQSTIPCPPILSLDCGTHRVLILALLLERFLAYNCSVIYEPSYLWWTRCSGCPCVAVRAYPFTLHALFHYQLFPYEMNTQWSTEHYPIDIHTTCWIISCKRYEFTSYTLSVSLSISSLSFRSLKFRERKNLYVVQWYQNWVA